MTLATRFDKKHTIKNFLLAFFLCAPILFKVLLPSELETSLTPNILGVYVFLPNLFLLLFMLLAERNSGLAKIKVVFTIQFIFVVLSFFVNDYIDGFVIFFSGIFYYFAMFMALSYNINTIQREYVGKMFACSVLLLDLEVYLFATGMLSTYDNAVLTGEVSGNFFRVATTAGASTGTACIIFSMTMICLLLLKNKRIRVFVFICSLIATLMTVSRGGITAFVLYLLIWLFYTMRNNNKRRFKYLFSVLFVFGFLYYFGFFDAVLERHNILVDSEYGFTSGRLDRISLTLQDFYYNGDPLLGFGISNVFPSTELRLAFKDGVSILHPNAPHNSYVLVLAELGWIGLTLFFIFWILVLKKIKKNWKAFATILPIVLVLFNTETVVLIESEYIFIMSILLMLSFDSKRMEQLYSL